MDVDAFIGQREFDAETAEEGEGKKKEKLDERGVIAKLCMKPE